MEEEAYATSEAEEEEDARAIEVSHQRSEQHICRECCGKSGCDPRA
ncbi:hypothetical protein RvY_09512 [Ramazzottius varieornatus]|uniref:Uncharacterized protein n=1 Tax=Ramazzottius varieornatus TaxID=947166 RepID=A0A1D1V9P6_RAMVA|nr:hypothetical protein RvY_09512 [Ramazzottius varieornatus]